MERGWNATFDRQMPPETFMDLVASHDHPVVVEFGLWAWPANIKLLSEIEQAGAEPWWFFGDRMASKQAWREENRVSSRPFPDGLWNEVVEAMDTNWRMIAKLFGQRRMLRTVEAGPVHLPPDSIYGAMFGHEPEGSPERLGSRQGGG